MDGRARHPDPPVIVRSLRLGVDLGGVFDLVLSDTLGRDVMRSDDFRQPRVLTMFDLVLVSDVSLGRLGLILQQLGSICSRLFRRGVAGGRGASIRIGIAFMSLL